MIRATAVLASIWIVISSVAMASDKAVVVELFTSQGCSSCPPADAFFHESLSGREDVIALALHVDYWDYLGWKDHFASPQFSKRQKYYARAAGHRSVYTPQMIVGGQDHVVGTHPNEVKDLIKAHKRHDSPVDVSIARKGGQFHVEASAEKAIGPMVIQIVRYRPKEVVAVKRGENAGRDLTYSNIVDSWDVVAEWDGKEPIKIRTPARGDLPVVAIVQSRDHGPILAAARLR